MTNILDEAEDLCKLFPSRLECGLAYGHAMDYYAVVLMPAVLAEARRLEKVITEPVESFGTPELVAWIEDIHKLVHETPESERGQIPFVMDMGRKLEQIVKSWRSLAMKGLTEDRDLWKATAIEGRAKALVYRDLLYKIYEDETLLDSPVRFWPGDVPEYPCQDLNEKAVAKYREQAAREMEGEIISKTV